MATVHTARLSAAAASAIFLLLACGDGDGDEQGWNPSDPSGGEMSGETGDTSGNTSGVSMSVGSLEGSSSSADPTLDPPSTGGSETGDPSETDTDDPGFDCTPWAATWIGAPCTGDGDCSYDGGTCILEEDGFPCGTCSQPCEMLCPDLEGAPETFCVDGSDVGLGATGQCISKCDPGLLGGNGCRDGYACSAFNRWNDPDVSAGVCVPIPFAGDGDTNCQQALLDLGAVFEAVDHTPESPAGFPALTCAIDDPVLLHSPVNGVALRYVDSADDAEVFVGCQAALSIVGSAAVAQNLGADELIHIGTYNCRVISGTTTISEHGLANAIDIYGFGLGDGTEFTLIDDWEDGNPNPTTPGGTMLRDFSDTVWAMGLWNIILSPEFSAAHDNHFHVDLKEGGNTYE